MDTTSKSVQNAIELIASIFDLPKPREEKCRTLYQLALRSTGNIVELGTYHGNGAIALCLGKKPDQLVYTVDDYKPKVGWSGEPYGPDDKMRFIENCQNAKVYPILIEKTFVKAAKVNTDPVGLLFWDGGKYELESAMSAWFDKIIPGGTLAIHDTYTNILGAKEYVMRMVLDGKLCQYEVMPGGVHVAVKV